MHRFVNLKLKRSPSTFADLGSIKLAFSGRWFKNSINCVPGSYIFALSDKVWYYEIA